MALTFNESYSEIPADSTGGSDIINMSMWVGGILGVVGCTFNVMAWLSFNQAEIRSSSIVLYQLLAVFDFLSCLLDGVTEMLVPAVWGYDVAVAGAGRWWGRWLCKAFRWFDGVPNLTAIYMVVAITIDRLVAIRYASWYRLHSSRGHGVAYGLVVVVFALVAESPALYLSEIEHQVCAFHRKALSPRQFQVYLYGYRLYALFLVVPATLILVFSVLYIRELTSSNTVKSTSQGKREQFERGMKRMLVLLNVSFLLLILPSFTLFGLDSGAHSGLFYYLGETLLISQHTVNLYLYLLSGPAFRRMFLRAVGCGAAGRGEGGSSTGGAGN